MTVFAQRNGVRVIAFNKCGHTSVISTFIQWRSGFINPEPPTVTEANIDPAALRTATPSHIRDWPDPHLMIAVLRDPAQRALSAYKHFIQRKERYKFTELGFVFGSSFAQYLNHLETVDLTQDPHLAPFTPDLIEHVKCPVILLPMEHLHREWPRVIQAAGLDDVPLEIFHKNKSDYEYTLTDDEVARLRTLYSADYRVWKVAYDETRAPFSPICYSTPKELLYLGNQ